MFEAALKEQLSVSLRFKNRLNLSVDEIPNSPYHVNHALKEDMTVLWPFDTFTVAGDARSARMDAH